MQFGQNNFIETEQKRKRLKQTIHFFLIIYVVVDLVGYCYHSVNVIILILLQSVSCNTNCTSFISILMHIDEAYVTYVTYLGMFQWNPWFIWIWKYGFFQNLCQWNNARCRSPSGSSPTLPTLNLRASSTQPCHPSPSTARTPPTWPPWRRSRLFQARLTRLTRLRVRSRVRSRSGRSGSSARPTRISCSRCSTPSRRRRPRGGFTLSEGEGITIIK